MSAFVDVAIVVAVLGVARSGWRRGMVFFLVDLVGFAVAVLTAVRFHEIPATALRAVGVDAGLANVLGGLAIFIPLIVVVAMLGSRMSKAMYKPGLFMLDKILGVALAAALAVTVVVVAVLFLRTVLPAPAAGVLARSAIADAVVDASAPAVAFADDRLGLDLCGGRLAEVIPEVCERPGGPGG